MNREEFIKIVKEKIENEHAYCKDKKYIIENYQKCKNAIYFLYDKNDKVIYVGMVGNKEKTSFAHRMYLHSGGAHEKKEWFTQVKKFRVKEFPNLEDKELRKIERLMIFVKQPLFNDSYITEDEYELLARKL